VGYLWGVHVAIIGLGGIGASVGLAVQHEALGWGVVGYDVAPDALTGALQMGAIDHPAESVAACADADLIVIATPPLAMPEVFQQLAPRLRPETALTDVASVKSPVLRWAEAYLPYPSRFVGGHPIAGTEHHGVRAARADLFHGAPWALTPTAQTDPDALQRVEAFVQTLRAAPLIMDAAQHDREFALLSFRPARRCVQPRCAAPREPHDRAPRRQLAFGDARRPKRPRAVGATDGAKPRADAPVAGATRPAATDACRRA
jgi:prephenate dehydrogenase